jgi:hypothetical protein
MSTAITIEVKGNFFTINNNVTKQDLIRLPAQAVSFVRQADYFAFYDRATGQLLTPEGQYSSTAGNLSEISIDQPAPVFGTAFIYSDLSDNLGAIFASADDLEDYLVNIIGALNLSGFLTYVATDSTLTGDGTPANPLSVVPIGDTYQERWDILTPLMPSAWHPIPSGAPANSLLTIAIDSNVNNNTVGVRQIGSSLQRLLTIDKDSTAFFIVRADVSSDIEIYTLDTDCIVRVESYL